MKTMNKMGLGCLALALCLPAMYSTQSLAQDTSGPPPAQQPDGAGQQGGRPSMEQMRVTAVPISRSGAIGEHGQSL